MKIPLFVPALVAAFLILNAMAFHGVINGVLLGLRLIDRPLRMLNDKFGWGVLAIQVWKNLPFQLLILASVLATIRTDIEDAARNLGAGPWQVLRHIILPLSMPGILIAVVLVFIMTFGDFAITRIAGPIYPILARRAHAHEGADPERVEPGGLHRHGHHGRLARLRGRLRAHGARCCRGRRHDGASPCRARLRACRACRSASSWLRWRQSCCCCGRACRC